MIDTPLSPPILATATIGIGAVERELGLSKDTLRIWERRYSFPTPLRDAFGERVYAPDQVDKLRVIKHLMDQGMRPGKLMHHSLAELRDLREAHVSATGLPASVECAALVELVRSHRIEELRGALGQLLLRHGLARFVSEIVAQLNHAVGEAWVSGKLEIFEEHLYTESIKIVLRGAIASVPRSRRSPRVLLTTFQREEHALGLLMAEAVLALEGAHCVSLGVQTPVSDIVRAAVSQQADIVALSFSAAYAPGQLLDGLTGLRAVLPGGMEIWAGGSAVTQLRHRPAQIQVIDSLAGVGAALAAWRLRSPAA